MGNECMQLKYMRNWTVCLLLYSGIEFIYCLHLNAIYRTLLGYCPCFGNANVLAKFQICFLLYFNIVHVYTAPIPLFWPWPQKSSQVLNTVIPVKSSTVYILSEISFYSNAAWFQKIWLLDNFYDFACTSTTTEYNFFYSSSFNSTDSFIIT